jgi:membrane associated rhomboid family serine protease
VLLLNLAITFLVPGIAIGGHLGGLAVGAVCGYTMTGHGRQPPKWTAAVPVALMVLAVAVAEFAARR